MLKENLDWWGKRSEWHTQFDSHENTWLVGYAKRTVKNLNDVNIHVHVCMWLAEYLVVRIRVHVCVWLRDLGKPVGGTCYPTEGLSATSDRMNLMPPGCYARAHWRARLAHSQASKIPAGASVRRCKHTNKLSAPPAAIERTYMMPWRRMINNGICLLYCWDVCSYKCWWWCGHFMNPSVPRSYIQPSRVKKGKTIR